MPNLGTPTPIRNLDATVKLYGLFRDYIKHEDGLINNRVTWLAQIHGFLYATFGFCLQKKVEVIQQVSSHVDKIHGTFIYMAKSHLGSSLLELDGFMIFLSVIGILLSRNTTKSIRAATRAINGISAIFYSQSNLQIYGLSGQKLYNTDVIQEAFPIKLDDGTLFFMPMLVGGGSGEAHDLGFKAPRRLPRILEFGWWASFAYFAFDIITNRYYLFHDILLWFKPYRGDLIFQILTNIGVH